MCSSFKNCTMSAVLCYCCLFKLIYSSTTNRQGLWFMPSHVGKTTKDVYMTISSRKMKWANIDVWLERFVRCFCVWRASWKTERLKHGFQWCPLVACFLPCGEHGSERGEGGGVFLQSLELVPQFHHGLGHHGLLVLILALEVCQSDFSCLWEDETRRTKGLEQLDGAEIIFPETRRLLIWTIWPFFFCFWIIKEAQ